MNFIMKSYSHKSKVYMSSIINSNAIYAYLDDNIVSGSVKLSL